MEETRTRSKGMARRAAPLIAIAAGALMLIFAAFFNSLEVFVPADAPAASPGEVSLPDERTTAVPQPSGDEDGTAEREILILTENDVIRETTRGGVVLSRDGAIQRTWADEPPEACPT